MRVLKEVGVPGLVGMDAGWVSVGCLVKVEVIVERILEGGSETGKILYCAGGEGGEMVGECGVEGSFVDESRGGEGAFFRSGGCGWGG